MTGQDGWAAMPEFLGFDPHTKPFVSAGPAGLALHFRRDQLQSLMSVQRPYQLEVPYTKTMMGFLLLKPAPSHILMIGLGGGSLVKFCYQYLRATRITVVEINPHVIALRNMFHIPEDDARLKVVHADGAHFVQSAGPEFDVLMVDGFDAQGQSDQLSSSDFYEDCYRVLMPTGVMVANLDGEHPAHSVFVRRIQQVFEGNFLEMGVAERSNVIVFARKQKALSSKGSNLRCALEQQSKEVRDQLAIELQHMAQSLAQCPGDDL
jgi:spermidine synthase